MTLEVTQFESGRNWILPQTLIPISVPYDAVVQALSGCNLDPGVLILPLPYLVHERKGAGTKSPTLTVWELAFLASYTLKW